MAKAEFVHLHVHSEFSLLDGLCRVPELVARARELEMPALALTDHGALYAALPFYQAAQEQGIVPIIGVEAYVARGALRRDGRPSGGSKPYHLVLLAQNETGYRNLMKLVTTSHLEGFYYKPRIDKDTLAKHAQGLIALSACASGEIPRAILEDNLEEARRAAAWYWDVFGAGNFYLELQEHDTPELRKIAAALVEIGQQLEIPLVATNDVHYVRPEQAKAQELLLCIQTNTSINDPKRMRMQGTGFHLRSAEEMHQLFAAVPQALRSTLEIAERCSLTFELGSTHLPHYPVPEGTTPDHYLAQLCEGALPRRYPNPTLQVRERLDHELRLIRKMGFAPYFLILWDLIQFARSQGILVGPGRGSAAGSLVAYLLGITDLDPLAYGLSFERFLNPGRTSMPDVDLDFPDDRRGEIIEYVVEKYGQDRVAQIITFGTMAARAAIRDAGRALDLPPGEVDRVAKLIPFGSTLREALEGSSELHSLVEGQEYMRDLIEAAMSLEGVARHASTHAAGVVISDRPLTEYVPLQKAIRGGEGLITQYDMNDLQRLGLLKIDLLGLATLTIIRRTLDLVNERYAAQLSAPLTQDGIELNDPAIYELLSRGDVWGVFQLESAGMRRVLRDLRPSRFEDVMACIALYRPGPMKYIGEFIRRKHGQSPIAYLVPELEPILSETYGIIVYQEQVIQIAMQLAGFSPSQADLLREAIGKKKAEALKRQRDKFIAGCVERGVTREVAQALFDSLEYFGRYGFNKSHAAAYAVITCQTAYLKAQYPAEYMAAFLSVKKGVADDVAAGVAECRRLGIEVLPPSVNCSDWDFRVEDHKVRFGLGAIKNVGEGAVLAIVGARGQAPFHNIEELARRADLRQVNRRALECLIRCGALDELGSRAQLLEAIDSVLATSGKSHQARESGQMSFFEANRSSNNESMLHLPQVPEVTLKEKLAWEKELTGIYISEHPLQRIVGDLEQQVTIFPGQIDRTLDGQRVVTAGVVAAIRRITTRKGDPMAFVRLEDLQGEIEVIVFPKTYERTRELWEAERILVVAGKVQAEEERVRLVCDEASEFAPGEPAVAEPMLARAKVESPFAVEAEDTIPSQPSAPSPPVPNARPAAGGQTGRPQYQLHITLPRSLNIEQEINYLSEVHDLLMQHPGQDRFSLYIPRGEELLQLDFPNAATGYSVALERALKALLGEGSLRIEPLSPEGQ